MTADPYAQWRKWLRGEDNREYIRGLSAGFYKVRHGDDDRWHPLAVFELGGELVGLFRGEIFTADELIDDLQIWPRAARHAIDEATYRAVAERNEPWPQRNRSKP
jgi:hypothetical protein